MNHLLILLFFVASTLTSFAQKETTSRGGNRVDNVNANGVILNKTQKDWLNTNYKHVAILRKDIAAKLVKENFPTANEATQEFLLSEALRMQQTDNSSAQSNLQQQETELKKQKQTLLSRITQKEAEAAATRDKSKKEKSEAEILSLKREAVRLNALIEDTIQKLRKFKE